MRLSSRLLAPVLAGAMLLLPAALSAHGSQASSSSTGGFTQALNSYRASHGRGPLVADPALTAAAQAYAQDMVSHGYFSHRGRDGATVGSRAARAGCAWGDAAENLGSGYANEAHVIQGWIGSPGHRRAMLGRNYSRYGLGRVGNIWVLMLTDQC
jgi:uncharacterized protein YkwD